ncbi:MAG: protein phosphatase 2C domain-containing protein [bacterium]|nr:protein phosphatase 2C domain-containing protein [bacterium]MDE0234778.1 protein phosphatase 2C domain-containing protein [bacterium]
MLKVAVLTRRGSGREVNQDRVVVGDAVVDSDQPNAVVFTAKFPTLVAVLDGLGGHPAGDIASSLAAEVVASESPGVETEQDVIGLVEQANRFLYDAMLVHKGLRDMGTTIAGAVVTADKVVVFHVGDSRVYLHTGGYLTQVTVDDWDDGHITQTLGGYSWFHPIEVHTITLPLRDGRILAATDGLFGLTDRARLSEAMNGPLEAVPDRLFKVAIESGNTDDFSVAVVETASP